MSTARNPPSTARRTLSPCPRRESFGTDSGTVKTCSMLLSAFGSLMVGPRGAGSPLRILGQTMFASLTRRPSHRASTEHVAVHVEYGLAGVTPRVEYQPELAIALIFSNLSADSDHFCEQAGVNGRQRSDIVVVLFRQHEHVRWCLRINIDNREDALCLTHHGRRGLTRRNLAKNTVSFHASRLSLNYLRCVSEWPGVHWD